MMGLVLEQSFANDTSNHTISPLPTYTNQLSSKTSTSHRANGPRPASLAPNSSQQSSPATQTATSASQPTKPPTQQWQWSKPTSSRRPPTRESCWSTKRVQDDTSLKSFSEESMNMERMCRRMRIPLFPWITF